MGRICLNLNLPFMHAFRKICLFLIYLIFYSAYAQQEEPEQIQITGKVVDGENGEPVPFCAVGVHQTSRGTISNELGEFILNIDSFPAKLVLRHTSYNGRLFEVSSDTGDLIIELNAAVRELREVTIEGSERDEYAIELARKALHKIQKSNSNFFYGKAFYRQTALNDSVYVELAEIFYDVRFSRDGIESWEVMEGRYALKENAILRNKNFTLLSRLMYATQPPTEDFVIPLTPEMETFYKPILIEVIKKDQREIGVVEFKAREDVDRPAFEGTVFIDLASYDVLKVHFEIENDNLQLVQLQNKDGDWENYRFAYEISFKPDSLSNQLLIDYFRIHQKFDYRFREQQLKSVSTSMLTFYDYYFPAGKKKLGGLLNFRKSDWKTLDEIGYNQQFWEENPIVKRTPVEEEVIENFERKNAFGTIYLNTRDQIAVRESNAVDDPFIKALSEKSRNYLVKQPIQKTYLHLDRKTYSPGETLWYSAFVVEGHAHHPAFRSPSLTVLFVSPSDSVLAEQIIPLENGQGNGSLLIPMDLPNGNCQIVAYTEWMKNFEEDFYFREKVTVISNKPLATDERKPTSPDIDLQFFPEGGRLIAGITGQVAFKVIGKDGSGVDVSGKVLDSQGNAVSFFKSMHMGMGSFFLTPKLNEEYHAVLDGSSGRIPLPSVYESGYGLLAKNLSDNSVEVMVTASQEFSEEPFYVVGSIRGRLYYADMFKPGRKNQVSFEIPKNKLPSGCLVITLFDKEGMPRSERVVFVNNEQVLNIQVIPDKNRYDAREKVKVDLRVTDNFGNPVRAGLSVSVTDEEQVNRDKYSGNLITHLFMESEVRGTIEDPGFYFENSDRSTLYALDMLMMTQAWRKINWEAVKQPKFNVPEHIDGKGVTVSGTAFVKNGNKPLSNASISMVPVSGDGMSIYETTTSSKGNFTFTNVSEFDSTLVVFVATNDRGNKTDISVILDRTKGAEIKNTAQALQIEQWNKTFLARAGERKQLDTVYDTPMEVILDEFVVESHRIEQVRSSVYNIEPDAVYKTKPTDQFSTFLQLLSAANLPGVRVIGNNVSIRGAAMAGRWSQYPLFIIDGVPVMGDSASTNNVNNLINPFDVERIETLIGPAAAIFGVRVGSGVILIYTKTGGEALSEPSKEFRTYPIKGYAVSREFYSPNYDVVSEEHAKPDKRATLYWNPILQTDAFGEASISFYNSDIARRLHVVIQGISSYGDPGVAETVFKHNVPVE